MNIKKIIEEAYFDSLSEMGANYGGMQPNFNKTPKPKISEVINISKADKNIVDKIVTKYGKTHEKDFFSSDYGTYYKYVPSPKDDESGGIKHKVIKLPSFNKFFNDLSDAVNQIKFLRTNKEVAGSENIRELFEDVKKVFRRTQFVIRKEFPVEYEIMKRQRTVIGESYKGYKEKHFDICPAAEALRDRLLNGEFGEPNEYELGEWLYQHDILFGTEKQVIQDKEGDRNDLRTAANAAKRIIHLSRDLNIPSKEINAYIPGHLKKIRDIVNYSMLTEYVAGSRHGSLVMKFKDLEAEIEKISNEGDFAVRRKSNPSDKVHHEWEIVPIGDVSSGEEKSGIRIYDYKFPFDPAKHKTDETHSFSVGGVNKMNTLSILKHLFGSEAKAAYGDINMNDIDPDAWVNSPINEAIDHNDPVLVRSRAAKMRADDMKKLDTLKKTNIGFNTGPTRKEKNARALVQKLKAKRAEIEREMENDPDIEPTGGPVADMYGDQLNKIDNAIEKAASVYSKPMDYDTAVGKINEEEVEKEGAELPDATDEMLQKFPTLKKTIVRLMTDDYKEFMDTIDYISPRPTAFKVNLTNGQSFTLKWMGKNFEATILGKRYYLGQLDNFQQALDKLSILYKEGPTQPEAPADTGAGDDFSNTDTGGDAAGGFSDAGGAAEPAPGGEDEGGADLGGEELGFEEPGEDPGA